MSYIIATRHSLIEITSDSVDRSETSENLLNYCHQLSNQQ